MERTHRPPSHLLYSAEHEHDACGVGFVAHLKGESRHEIVQMAREVLINMTHRGAVGAEKNTGDGAGVLTALPHALLERIAAEELHQTLPPRGRFAAGLVFLPQHRTEREACLATIERIIAEEGQRFIGWRAVPTADADIGPSAKGAEPVIQQLFVAANEGVTEAAFERALFIIRKRATHTLRGSRDDTHHFFTSAV